MPTKTTKTTKTVPVKSLRKAIQDGMILKEAAEHALEYLRLGGRDQDGPFPEMEQGDLLDFTKEFLRLLADENDHSIRFMAKDDCDGRSSWVLECNHPKCPSFNNLYNVGNCMYPDFTAEWDEAEFNQFILDFYGIKKHAERKPTKAEIRSKGGRLRAEIKNKQKEIKVLQAELKKLAKIS